MTTKFAFERRRRRQFLTLLASSVATGGLSACGGGGAPAAAVPSPSPSSQVPPQTSIPVAPSAPPAADPSPPSAPPVADPSPPSAPPASANKSTKRGIAYDLSAGADLAVLAPGVSWWYNWSSQPNSAVPSDYSARYGMDYYPMLWNGQFDATEVEAFLKAHADIKYLLLLNEPNLVDQSNLTPQQAAQLWPRYEAVAAHTGVKLVGPSITWGTMPGYDDPVLWLDAFYAAYKADNGGRDPQVDYLAFHWYDYGLAGQLDRLIKYGKPFWVTEMANWHSQADGAQVDTLEMQKAQMSAMVSLCESRADVFRYAWFTGRWSPDPHFTSLLGASGELTELGQYYLSLPFATV